MVIAAPTAPLLPLIGSAWLIAAILAFEQMRLETTNPAAAPADDQANYAAN
jgi:hypothetical protein